MRASKKIGKIYEGRWKIVSTKSVKTRNHIETIYVLENVYNEQQILISTTQLGRIERGTSSISKVLSYRVNASRKKNNEKSWNERKDLFDKWKRKMRYQNDNLH